MSAYIYIYIYMVDIGDITKSVNQGQRTAATRTNIKTTHFELRT